MSSENRIGVRHARVWWKSGRIDGEGYIEIGKMRIPVTRASREGIPRAFGIRRRRRVRFQADARTVYMYIFDWI